MPWKIVCDLWFHEVFTNDNLFAFVICLKIVVCINFMKPKVIDKRPWH